MKILDRDDIPYKEWEENCVNVIQDWGYTERGNFSEGYTWEVRVKGEYISSYLGKASAIEAATKYANSNGINTIYYSGARKSYYKE
jgi:hypothetical protein